MLNHPSYGGDSDGLSYQDGFFIFRACLHLFFFFHVLRVVSIHLIQIKTTTQSKIKPQIIDWFRRLIKHIPAPSVWISSSSTSCPVSFSVSSLTPRRLVSAAEGSGHGGREELAGDLSQCGDHDGGLLPESLSGFGQEEGGSDHHRLWDWETDWDPQEGITSYHRLPPALQLFGNPWSLNFYLRKDSFIFHLHDVTSNVAWSLCSFKNLQPKVHNRTFLGSVNKCTPFFNFHQKKKVPSVFGKGVQREVEELI